LSTHPLTRSPGIDWILVAILLVALAFRLYRIDVPYVDAHSWRQITNADIARNWTEGPIQFARPTVNWGGPDGRVGMEFPLLHLLTALVWRASGVSSAAGRLVPVVFSVGTVWVLYLLGTRMFGRPAGRAAAFVLATSPTTVYFGRTLLSDVPMLFFSVGAVLGYAAYAQSGRRWHAFAGTLSLALAGLVKIPAILVLGPVVWIGLVTRGRYVFRDPWYVAAPLAAMGAVAVWYLHADLVYQSTGLTQAIFRPSGTYPGEIAASAGPFTTVSHWTRPELLNRDTARWLVDRYFYVHLTPVVAALAMAGMALVWRPLVWRTVVDIWALSALALVLVSLAGQIPHEFHQLPTLPPLALYAGLAAQALFGPRIWSRLGRFRVPAAAAAGALAVAGAVYAFQSSGVVRHLYRTGMMNFAIVNAGRAIEAATPEGSLMATVDYDQYGSNSPLLLYFAHRRGWAFDGVSITPAVLVYLETRQHVCYFATADWQRLGGARRDIVEYLSQKREIQLPGVHPQYRLFDLCGDSARP
jgi:4-amino-4-deoxy-L-arabinose transferase-like glycosyltransferase